MPRRRCLRTSAVSKCESRPLTSADTSTPLPNSLKKWGSKSWWISELKIWPKRWSKLGRSESRPRLIKPIVTRWSASSLKIAPRSTSFRGRRNLRRMRRLRKRRESKKWRLLKLNYSTRSRRLRLRNCKSLINLRRSCTSSSSAWGNESLRILLALRWHWIRRLRLAASRSKVDSHLATCNKSHRTRATDRQIKCNTMVRMDRAANSTLSSDIK